MRPSEAEASRPRSRLKKILVVDPDPVRTPALLANLDRSGFKATGAEGCLHALTMLEWHRPDLILVRSEVEDMTPAEFCRTVRQDPLFNKVPTALLSPVDSGEFPNPDISVFDLVLKAGDVDHETTQVSELLWRGFDASAPKGTVSDKETQAENDLRQQIAVFEQAMKTGLLHVETEGNLDVRFLLFDHGQIIHAELGRLHGPIALDRILLDTEGAAMKKYRFEELPRWKITAYPRSIRRAERRKSLGSDQDPAHDPRATREIDLNEWQSR